MILYLWFWNTKYIDLHPLIIIHLEVVILALGLYLKIMNIKTNFIFKSCAKCEKLHVHIYTLRISCPKSTSAGLVTPQFVSVSLLANYLCDINGVVSQINSMSLLKFVSYLGNTQIQYQGWCQVFLPFVLIMWKSSKW